MVERAVLPSPQAFVVGVGLRAPNGLTALQVTMCVRADKLRPRDSYLVDRAGDPIALARLASIGDDVQGLPRLLALGAPALRQATFPWLAHEAAARRAPRPLPLVIALPSAGRPGLDPRLGRELVAGLEQRAETALDHAASRLIFGCRAGGVAAFELGLSMLREGAPCVVVGGIDSWFEALALEHLDAELRLHSLTAENGFVPGEGAGFLVLARRASSDGPSPLARVLSTAVELEPRPWGSEEPTHALGMTQAVRRATAVTGSDAHRIGWAVTDVVNERHRVDEWSFVSARVHGALTPDWVHDQPLLVTGDLGAASVAAMAAMATTRWQTRCAPDDCVLVAAHSDGPERGAMVLAAA